MLRWCYVILLALFSCTSSITLQVRKAEPLPSQKSDVLLAGVAKTDITPRPGLPMIGYSANANYGDGFRTRLYSRAIYLKPADGTPIALVACDLLSGSELIHRRVAELVAKKTDLRLRDIVLTGTHTHSGPGNFFGSNFYTIHAGNKGGIDVEFLNFLTHQIANAITEAYEKRKPAKVALGKIEVYGFTRNRSIEAYRANINADPQKVTDRLKAVNPFMHMLRVDVFDEKSRKYVPAGAFTSFSIHGTTIPSDNHLYNGDVYAYMERELEWHVKKKYLTDFVHAVSNATHADNSPNVEKGRQGFKESRRLGIGLGEKCIALFQSLEAKLHQNVDVSTALREVDYYKNNSINGISLCIPPRVGNTLLAGASDGGPTPVLQWLPFFREGSKRWIFTCGCHGNRRIAGWPIQSIILPKDEFPHRITYQIVKIHDTLFIPLPYEVTMEAGRRIAESAKQHAELNGMRNVAHYVVLSCANGYTGYCTTPEEYSQQRYEGGHTLYGPNTAPFVAAQVGALVGDMARSGRIDETEREWSFVLSSRTFYKEYDQPKGLRAPLCEPIFAKGRGEEEDCVKFQWKDVPPSLIEWHRPLVSIESRTSDEDWKTLRIDGIPVTDEGYDVAVVFLYTNEGDGMWGYEARWYNPVKKDGIQYRFRIEARGHYPVLYSKEFNFNNISKHSHK
ncbi:MAG: neutral/alkaline non-lysosomal ceramidase N-terminal domain-containing protein [Spirochaetes bacterium]|nr:neutral/alkaline non-lysosomal ceramidase N-terminal domain-containing protein [Spirochaetota bacterium]